jgi:hypothetical protein
MLTKETCFAFFQTSVLFTDEFRRTYFLTKSQSELIFCSFELNNPLGRKN